MSPYWFGGGLTRDSTRTLDSVASRRCFWPVNRNVRQMSDAEDPIGTFDQNVQAVIRLMNCDREVQDLTIGYRRTTSFDTL